MSLKLDTPIEAILFDLDGTLVDTAADFVAVLERQARKHGVTCPDAQTIRNTVSDGARALTHLVFGGNEGEPVFEQRRAELLALYAEEVGNTAQMFPGMSGVLEHLKVHNLSWGIVTNKPRSYTLTLLSRLSLNPETLVCPDDVSVAKPDPEGIILAAQQLGVSIKNCLYVGDHERDIVAAQRAAMPSVAAAYGYIANEIDIACWQADAIIRTPEELLKLLT